MNMISLSVPIVGNEEKQALCDVIQSGWLTMGDRVAAFEEAFANLHDVGEAVAVCSCTAALHIALKALDIGPDDEVLVPSLSFVATVSAVLYVGATPVFVDIENIDQPHISIEDARAKITDKTKAVIVMHYGGYVVDLPIWRSFCDQHRLLLIEDAAHAPAIDQVGRLSDAAAFSFFSNKNMSTAEGGMLTARYDSILKQARHLRAHGMSTDTLTRHRGHAYSYDVNMLGFNYRMDELRAAMGLVQLSHLPNWNQKRYELSNCYRRLLKEQLPELTIPFDSSHKTAAHLLPILLQKKINRQKVMENPRSQGVQSSIHYPPIHQFSYYKKKLPQIDLPKTDAFSNRELTLPLHPSLTQNDILSVVAKLKNAIATT
jgi:dTDP-4-amino-4,6-dideoxygalactose transaminase